MTHSGYPRTLVMVRHAQAGGSGSTDAERPLTGHGADDAGAAGRWLKARGISVDAALVSSALRTRQTWEKLSGEAGYEVEAEFSPALYSAGPEQLLRHLRELPAHVESAVVVAHNPTVAQVSHDLAGLDDKLLRTVGFSPGTVIVFGIEQLWEELTSADVLGVSEGSRPR